MRRLKHLAIFAILAITAAGALRCQAQEPAATHDPREAELQQILADWKARSTAIWALDATQSLSQAIRGSGEQPLPPDTLQDPFADIPAPKDDTTVRTRAGIVFCKDRAATTTATKVQPINSPGRWAPQTIRISIEGNERRTLIEQEPPYQASVDFAPTPHNGVFPHQPYLAILLWLRPETLIRRGEWLYDEMYVEELDVTVDGVRCRRIVLPRKGGHMVSSIDVDPQRGHVPLRWEIRLQGKSVSLLTMRYRQDPTAGFVPSGWVDKLDDSEPTQAEVSINTINKEISEDRLSVAFPAGTFVTKSKGGIRTYGIQRDSGLEKLNKKKFSEELRKAQETIPKEI